MIGASAGDIIGSPYEHRPAGRADFPLFRQRSRFTDDTVLTVATAEAILAGTSYADAYRKWARRYPHAGYGRTFIDWFHIDDAPPYGSWGNGSAMRVSPVGLAFDSVARVLDEAEASAAVTHDHPEGIKGAQATALCVFLAHMREEMLDEFVISTMTAFPNAEYFEKVVLVMAGLGHSAPAATQTTEVPEQQQPV